MGQDISRSHFTQQDFQRFQTCLQAETAQLTEWFRTEHFSECSGVGGFEIEAWLVDRRGQPAPVSYTHLTLPTSDLV